MAESNCLRCLISPNLTTNKISGDAIRPHLLQISSLSRKHEASSAALHGGSSRPMKRLITLSPSEGKWNGNWNTQYNVSLRDLHLEDLVETGPTNVRVSVDLSVQRHASMGLSVDGRIITSFARKCSICSSSYPRLIDTNFTVWILPSSRENRASQLPEIGGDDPSLTLIPLYKTLSDSQLMPKIYARIPAKNRNRHCTILVKQIQLLFIRDGQNYLSLRRSRKTSSVFESLFSKSHKDFDTVHIQIYTTRIKTKRHRLGARNMLFGRKMLCFG